MKTDRAVEVLGALSSDARLDIFRLLVKNAPDGMVVGDIAQAIGIPSTTLSFHLKSLQHAGLAIIEKEGRYLRYRANTSLMFDLVDFLTAECCSGKTCRPPSSATRRTNVLTRGKARA